MSGLPKRQLLLQERQKRTRERFDENEAGEHTILDYVCVWIESGGTMLRLTDEVSDARRIALDRSSIPRLLRGMFGTTETETRLSDARSRASHVLAEESITLLDVPQSDMVGVSQARDRSRGRQWLAERWNRDQYGSTKGVQIAISVGGLHLDALRARQAAKALPASQAVLLQSGEPIAQPSNVEDAQVID